MDKCIDTKYKQCLFVLFTWGHWDWISHCANRSALWSSGTSSASDRLHSGTTFSLFHACVWHVADNGSLYSPSLFPFLCSYTVCGAVLGCWLNLQSSVVFQHQRHHWTCRQSRIAHVSQEHRGCDPYIWAVQDPTAKTSLIPCCRKASTIQLIPGKEMLHAH